LQKPSDSLVPFRYSAKDPAHEDCWTSDDVQDWTALGYTYHGKYVARGSSGQNELVTFPIEFGKTDPKQLNSFVNQFYGWTDTPADGFPDLLHQFYPINLSQVEALTGERASRSPLHAPVLPSHPERIPSDGPADPEKADYGFMSDLLTSNGEFRQWDVHIVAEK
jgi:hypothetical protein